MDQDDPKIIIQRYILDRRSGIQFPLPYVTDEGSIVIDRRSAEDRRVESRQAVHPAILRRIYVR
jgi:hypothetical protein